MGATTTDLTRDRIRTLSRLSPFELQAELIALAGSGPGGAARPVLHAGRGNPNWMATGPREAFLALGHFAMEESRRVWTADNLGGQPTTEACAARFEAFAAAHPGLPGVPLLKRCVAYGVERLGFTPDPWVHELVDAACGDNYLVPNRILPHCQDVVRAYLRRELCDERPPAGDYDVFAVEGGTAAMCYLFDSLSVNRLLRRGDRIALMTPIFTPYLEIPTLDRYALDVVHVRATSTTPDGVHSWDYPDAELDKLADPSIKALCMVNPSNPGSMDLSSRARDRVIDIVRRRNPDLIIITDDVYATFVPGFTTLAASLPRNTLLVYSYSKHYGATGWRLGVIALHQDNVIDELIAKLPAGDQEALRARYASVVLQPDKLAFIDRVVADSRQVALRHTAGLSGPQQAQLMLFSLFDLQPEGQEYKALLRGTVHRRLALLGEGADFAFTDDDPTRASYYVNIDILARARAEVSAEFADYLKATYEPVDLLFRLAERHSVVLLNGSGFDGPPWSVRVSLANLDDLDYLKIGHYLRKVMDGYKREWTESRGASQ
jgi:aspartate 4-decarboxylase